MRAVIPVAGRGTRIYPLGKTKPKCLLQVLNKPILSWTLESLLSNGIRDIILVIRPDSFGSQVKSYIDQNFSNNNINFDFVVQEKPLGTAHVLQMAKGFFIRKSKKSTQKRSSKDRCDHCESEQKSLIEQDDSNAHREEFIFINGDDLYSPISISRLVQADSLALLAKDDPSSPVYNPIVTDKDGNLIKIVEKAKEDYGNLLNIGGYRLNTRVFDIYDQIFPSSRGEYEITDTLELLSKEYPVKVCPISDNEYWIPVGYPWDILKANEKLISLNFSNGDSRSFTNNFKQKQDFDQQIRVISDNKHAYPETKSKGRLVVGENTKVGSGVEITGNVVIGDNCIIDGATELNEVCIGDGCKIVNSILSHSILADQVEFLDSVAFSDFEKTTEIDENIFSEVKGKMVDTGMKKFGCVVGEGTYISNSKLEPGLKIWPDKKVVNKSSIQSDLKDI